jgi:NDP-sugar pyrophosphorylase family protein
MMTSVPAELAGLVLAAGAGQRLRPLTRLRPKPLCPVADVPLVDLGLQRVARHVAEAAVNVHHGAGTIAAHVAGRAHVSHEVEQALGTAGAVGFLRPWLDGRAVLVVNGDAWTPTSLDPLLEGWDGVSLRVAIATDGELRAGVPVAGALVPAAAVARCEPVPSGLWGHLWKPALADGQLETINVHGPFVDCGTPADYLRANLLASGGRSVVGEGAEVEGELVRSVVWPGARVEAEERLVDAIRADDLTVLVRPRRGHAG